MWEGRSYWELVAESHLEPRAPDSQSGAPCSVFLQLSWTEGWVAEWGEERHTQEKDGIGQLRSRAPRRGVHWYIHLLN